MKDINVFDWLELTRPNKPGLTDAKKKELREMRERVFGHAQTSRNSLVVVKSRGNIGRVLYEKMLNATAYLDEEFRITVSYDDYTHTETKKRAIKDAMQKIEMAARA